MMLLLVTLFEDDQATEPYIQTWFGQLRVTIVWRDREREHVQKDVCESDYSWVFLAYV